MSRIEDRIKELATRVSQWLNTDKKTARQQRAERVARLRGEATERAHRAATRVQEFRESERGQRAASKLSDLRTSDTAKKAEAALADLRASEAAKKAEAALADLRQREPVKKAEENARKVFHDLFSGGPGADGTGDRTAS
jgi:hypothetical protein